MANPPDNSGVVFPPPFLYVIPLGIGILINRFHPAAILPRGIAVPIGILLVTLGMALIAFAIILFLRARTSPIPVKPTTAIVETGPYRFTRNPMYVGLALLYLGVTLWVDTPWPLLFLPLVLWLVRRLVIDREERYLEAKFGREYLDYKARVRRWI